MVPPESSLAQRDSRVEQIIEELTTESDRGCILIGASVLSDFLEDVLRDALSLTSHAVKHAVTPLFENMGPLSTFSAKIKLAYGLGLVDQDRFADLEKIRRIRNAAAHDYSSLSFESREIIVITSTLKSADDAVKALWDKKFDTKPRSDDAKPQPKISKERIRFTLTVSWIAGLLEARRASVALKR